METLCHLTFEQQLLVLWLVLVLVAVLQQYLAFLIVKILKHPFHFPRPLTPCCVCFLFNEASRGAGLHAKFKKKEKGVGGRTKPVRHHANK